MSKVVSHWSEWVQLERDGVGEMAECGLDEVDVGCSAGMFVLTMTRKMTGRQINMFITSVTCSTGVKVTGGEDLCRVQWKWFVFVVGLKVVTDKGGRIARGR